MELRGSDFDRIRREHLRGVTVTEFARLWWQAERRADALRAEDRSRLVPGRGAAACRWIANAWVQYDGPIEGRNGEMAKTPLTLKSAWVIEELIEEETLDAERLVGRWEWPGRPGYVEGVAATLTWAWRRSGVPPIQVEQRARGLIQAGWHREGASGEPWVRLPEARFVGLYGKV